MNEYQRKIRSVAAPRRLGQKETRVIRNEETGGVAGRETEHWDGRQDAVALPDTVKYKLQPE